MKRAEQYIQLNTRAKENQHLGFSIHINDSILPFLRPYMGVIPNPKNGLYFPNLCILVLIFPTFMIYFPKCERKGSFPNPQNIHCI